MKKKFKKMYFMGVKGVGMTALAIIAKQAGVDVAGSDIEEEFITDKLLESEGIIPFRGFDQENVEKFVGSTNPSDVLFVATGAHGGFGNIEAKYAEGIGVKVVSHGQAVGLFMDGEILGRADLIGVSVAGSHGKTTISGMAAASLVKLRLDPTYAIGTSEVFPLGAGGHFGKGNYFVAEADEYLSELNYDRTPKFLYQKPKFLIINNIDFDHPDFYSSIDEVEKAFGKLLGNLEAGSVVIANGDDERVKKIIKDLPIVVSVVTYGTNKDNDLVLDKFYQEKEASSFEVISRGTALGRLNLKVPGFHNAKNSLAVVALLFEMGISFEKIKDGLFSFEGSKRRMELLGETREGLKIIDDYAHHPEEIRKTLSSIKGMYPDKKIIVVFQPHTFSRTNAMLSDFVSSFSDANTLLLLPTYASLRTNETTGDDKLMQGFEKINKNAVMLESIDNMVEYVGKNFRDPSYVLITMGAGDVYKVGERLAEMKVEN